MPSTGHARTDSPSRPTCFGKRATLVGTRRADVIRGTRGADVIVGLGGVDRLYGRGGADLVCGGPGADVIVGGPGRDRADGGPGRDTCSAVERRTRCPLPVARRQVTAASAGGGGIRLAFDGPVSPGHGDAALYAVSVDGRPADVTAVATAKTSVTLTTGVGILSDDVVVVRSTGAGRRILAPFSLTAATAAAPPGCSDELGAPAPDRATEGPTDYRRFLRPAGTLSAAVLSADFADSRHGALRPLGFPARLPGRMRELSNGRLTVSGFALDRWIELSRPQGAYALHRGAEWAGVEPFLRDVVTAANPFVDFSSTKVVYVGHAGPGKGLVGAGVVAVHVRPPGGGIGADGNELRSFVVGPLPLERIEPATLELFGLPPLTGQGSEWDLMGGSLFDDGLLAWHLRKLGWIDHTQVRCVRSGTFEAVLRPVSLPGGLKALVLPTGPTSAYVVENRQPLGPDARICDKGALVYRVDAAAFVGAVRIGGPFSTAFGCYGNVPLDLGPGETPVFVDAAAQVRIEVVSVEPDGYRVRVTRG